MHGRPGAHTACVRPNNREGVRGTRNNGQSPAAQVTAERRIDIHILSNLSTTAAKAIQPATREPRASCYLKLVLVNVRGRISYNSKIKRQNAKQIEFSPNLGSPARMIFGPVRPVGI